MTPVWLAGPLRSRGAGHQGQAAALLRHSVSARPARPRVLGSRAGLGLLLPGSGVTATVHRPHSLPRSLSCLLAWGPHTPAAPVDTWYHVQTLGRAASPALTPTDAHAALASVAQPCHGSAAASSQVAAQVPGLEPGGAAATGRSGPAWSAGQGEHPGSRKERQGRGPPFTFCPPHSLSTLSRSF